MKDFLAINIHRLVQESQTLPDLLARSVQLKIYSVIKIYKDDLMFMLGGLAHEAGQLAIAPDVYSYEINKIKTHLDLFNKSLNYLKELKGMFLKDREWVYSNGEMIRKSDTKPYPISNTDLMINTAYILSRKVDAGEIHKKIDKILLETETLNKKNALALNMDLLLKFFKFFKRGIVGYQIQIETIHWLFRTFPELQYHNISGLCLAGTKKELAELTQNEPDYFYVSLDDPFDYELTFKKLKKALTLCESGI